MIKYWIPVGRDGTDISDIGQIKNMGYQLETTDMPSLSNGIIGEMMLLGDFKARMTGIL